MPQLPEEYVGRRMGGDCDRDREYDVIRVRQLLKKFNGPFSAFARSVAPMR